MEPRKISSAELEKLQRSLEEFGTVEPIVVNETTGNVVGGHQRLRALLAAGHTVTDVIVMKLDESREKQLNIALNKISGDWDDDMLREVFQELLADGADLTLTGFDEDEWNALLPTQEGLTDPDEIPEVVETRCKLSDIWQLGEHRLLCGDASDYQNIRRVIRQDRVAMVFADPPYEMEFQTLFFIASQVKPLADLHFWMLPDKTAARMASTLGDFAKFFVHDFVQPTMINSRNVMNRHTLIAQFGTRSINNLRDGFCTILEIPTLRTTKEHKEFRWGKRVELPQTFIRHYCQAGDMVLDPFGGSGSTIIACEKSHNVCCAIELEPRYCDLIIRRWELFTRRTACLFVE